MDLNYWIKTGLVIKESIKIKLGLLEEEGIEEEEEEGIGNGEKKESKKELDLRRVIVSVRRDLNKIILK